MVVDLFRDSSVGQLINYASSGRYLSYEDQRPGYVVPSRFLPPGPSKERPDSSSSPTYDASESATICNKDTQLDGNATRTPSFELQRDGTLVYDSEKSQQLANVKMALPDPYLVDWYSDDDPDNPRNWSPPKRAFVALCISLLTFTMYIGSAIYTPSIPGLMEDFNTSLVVATLGLTLYVIGYGVGPMFLTPLQEMAVFGRNTIYISTLFIFIIFQIPIITATNIRTVLVFRFLTGFFGSPALATGGASMSDLYPSRQLSYVIGVWALGAVAGPITGPVIGGFAAQANGWRWPQYELIWISAFAFILLSCVLPETYGPTVLLKRAQRLRRLTGNQQLRSQSEKDAEGESMRQIMKDALIQPFVLAMEPALMFANIYIGFIYAIFYLWFEAFPIVFRDIYGWNLGVSNLPFLGFVVSGAITYTVYCFYQLYHISPRVDAIEAAGREVPPEIRLEIGFMASIFIPTSVLIFGFASKESIHWIVPVIGASLYLPGIFLNFQSILMYITSAYPQHEASVLAGNDVFRSCIASVFPLFGHAFFTNLGLGPASAILAGVSFALWPVFWALIKWGHVLRRRSRYAKSTA